MRGCTGARRTQARTPTCKSPPTLALHPRLNVLRWRLARPASLEPVRSVQTRRVQGLDLGHKDSRLGGSGEPGDRAIVSGERFAGTRP